MKKVKTIIAIMLIMSIFFGIVGCNNSQKIEETTDDEFINEIEEISEDEFRNAVEDFFEVNEEEFYETDENGCHRIIYSYGASCEVLFDKHVNRSDMLDFRMDLQSTYNLIENGNYVIDEVVVEDIIYNIGDRSGYLVYTTSDEYLIDYHILNPEGIDRALIAIYFIESTFVMVIGTNDDIDETLEFIDSLGLPNL